MGDAPDGLQCGGVVELLKEAHAVDVVEGVGEVHFERKTRQKQSRKTTRRKSTKRRRRRNKTRSSVRCRDREVVQHQPDSSYLRVTR